MDMVVFKEGGEMETLGDCERKMAVFCAIDAYLGYDVEGRPADPDRITQQQVHAMNRAMGARSPLEAWREAELLDVPLPELRALDTSQDLVAMSDEEWRQIGPKLGELYERVIRQPRVGIARGTKVLHLMRPRLVAIADSVVLGYLGVAPKQPVQRALRLADSIRAIGRARDNQAALAGVRDYLARFDFIREKGVPSACRILDALLWMKGRGRYDHLWTVMGVSNP
jgi:hypothetical protein